MVLKRLSCYVFMTGFDCITSTGSRRYTLLWSRLGKRVFAVSPSLCLHMLLLAALIARFELWS